MKHAVPKNKLSDKDYRQIFRMVDGSIVDYIHCHPKFFPKRMRGTIRQGLSRRITGTLKGYFVQAKRGRSEGKSKAVSG